MACQQEYADRERGAALAAGPSDCSRSCSSAALAEVKEPATPTALAARFARAKATDVGEILETLCAVGKAHRAPSPGAFLP